MEFNKKLQELRKQKGITQEELAKALYVSRTAISKWESGRGYPNIDSLKAIADFFGLTVDQLLSGDELLTIAEESGMQKATLIHRLIFGLLDCGVSLLLFLPLFGKKLGNVIQPVSLLGLTNIPDYLKTGYFALVISSVLTGLATLALLKIEQPILQRSLKKWSLCYNGMGAVLCVINTQPYAATLLLVFLGIKALMLIIHK